MVGRCATHANRYVQNACSPTIARKSVSNHQRLSLANRNPLRKLPLRENRFAGRNPDTLKDSHPMPERLLERFVRYAQMDTQADERSSSYPSTPNQLVLGRLLHDELRSLGLTDVKQTEHGIVYATVPGNVAESVPTVALVACMHKRLVTFNAMVRTNKARDKSIHGA